MNTILVTNTRVVNVENNNGVLNITDTDSKEIKNPGLFIKTMGGVDAILSRCIQTEKSAKEVLDNIKAEKEAKKSANAQRNEGIKAAYKDAYESLLAKGMIESTAGNIGIVIRYLNTQNWGTWRLPKMSIGYKAIQYQINGNHTATTMTLDKTINYDGKKLSKFVVGAPANYLTPYEHIR